MAELVYTSKDFIVKNSNLESRTYSILQLACSSVIEAFNKFISSVSTISSFDVIVIKIDKDLSPLSIEQLDKFNSVLSQQEKLKFVSLTSTVSKLSWIYWKLPEWKKIFGLYEFVDVYKDENDEGRPEKGFIHHFMLSSIINQHSGLIPQTKLDKMEENIQNIRLDFVGNTDNQNLLMIAAESKELIDDNNKLKIINHLIDLNLDISYEANGKSVTNFSKNQKILLALLKAGATYPSNFNKPSLENKDLIDLIKHSEDIHSIVGAEKKRKNKKSKLEYENDIIDKLKKALQSCVKTPNFYNSKNVSAPVAAIKAENFKVYDFLTQNQVSLGKHEMIDVSVDMKEHFAETHSKLTQNWYLPVLVGNSSVGHDLRDNNYEKWKYVKEAFIVLNEIPEVQPLLILVAASKDFEIVFEFNRDSIHHLDPRSDSSVKGILRYKGFNRIYVSAKEFLDSNPKEKFKAIGTLAHEVCHFAMLLLNRNFCNPSMVNDKEAEKNFERILQTVKSNENITEPILRQTFKYPEKNHHKELIVRIPHILAALNHEDDKLRLKEILKDLKELHDFYTSLLPKILAAVPVVTKMVKDPKGMKYDDLTDELKTKIRESLVNFQGEKVNFGELTSAFKNGSRVDEVFQLLSSDQILMIINDEVINISKELNFESNEYVERILEVDNSSSENINLNRPRKEKELSYKKLIDESLVMLSDDPGFGKTTIFKHIANNFKKSKKLMWMSYIDLKNHEQIFKNIDKNSTFDVNFVQKIIMTMLNIDPQTNFLETEIFIGCWECKNMILFFDSIDEIHLAFHEFILSLLLKIHNEGLIQLWIAFRRDKIHKICQEFGKDCFYSIKPFNDEDQKNFLILKLSKIYDNMEKRQKMLANIQQFISNIGKCIFLLDRSVKNPLMLHLIVEIFVEDENANTITSNYFMLLQKIFAKVILKRGVDDPTINLLEAHQAIALRINFQMKTIDCTNNILQDLHNLEIFRKGVNLSPFDFTKYGIIYALSEADCFFVHIAFMEFLVARYLVDNIYNSDGSEDEIKLRLNLLYQVGSLSKFQYKIHCEFIIDYLNYKLSNNEKILLTESFKNILQTYFKDAMYNCFDALQFISKFFSYDKEFFKIFWRIEKNESFLPWYSRIHTYEWFNHRSQLTKLIETLTEGEVMEKVKYGKSQKGEILYRIWKQNRIYQYNETGKSPIPICFEPDDISSKILTILHQDGNYDKYREALIEDMGINVEGSIVNYIIEPISFYNFYKYIELLLTEDEKREMFIRHGFYILLRFLMNKQQFLEIWNTILTILGKLEFEHSIIKPGKSREPSEMFKVLFDDTLRQEALKYTDFYASFFQKLNSFDYS